MGEPCIYEGKISEIATDLKNLKENFETFRDNEFHEVKNSINCIIEKINRPRFPIWITWLLTLCSGLIVGLVITILKR